MNAAAIENVLRTRLEQERGVVAAYLFGSLARGEVTGRSDVDVAVFCDEEPVRTLDDLPLALEGRLERALGAEVQVVLLDRAPADLVHRVLRDGRLLLDREPARRVAFEVRRRNEYFDLLPILERYRAPRGAQPEAGR